VTYEEFISEIAKAGLSIRAFADLLRMRPNSISNNAKRGQIPAHLAIIASLLAELHVHGIPYKPILDRLSPSKKKPRGGAVSGKFGGDKQGRLELES
jgi:hypothetical protein